MSIRDVEKKAESGFSSSKMAKIPNSLTDRLGHKNEEKGIYIPGKQRRGDIIRPRSKRFKHEIKSFYVAKKAPPGKTTTTNTLITKRPASTQIFYITSTLTVHPNYRFKNGNKLEKMELQGRI